MLFPEEGDIISLQQGMVSEEGNYRNKTFSYQKIIKNKLILCNDIYLY